MGGVSETLGEISSKRSKTNNHYNIYNITFEIQYEEASSLLRALCSQRASEKMGLKRAKEIFFKSIAKMISLFFLPRSRKGERQKKMEKKKFGVCVKSCVKQRKKLKTHKMLISHKKNETENSSTQKSLRLPHTPISGRRLKINFFSQSTQELCNVRHKQFSVISFAP
jgi:hypothetical protein